VPRAGRLSKKAPSVRARRANPGAVEAQDLPSRRIVTSVAARFRTDSREETRSRPRYLIDAIPTCLTSGGSAMTLSGKAGQDAKPYQEKEVRTAIQEVQP